MDWQAELRRINQIGDSQIKLIMAAYLFMNTYNRALMILGEGTCQQKVSNFLSENDGLAARWKRMLRGRLGPLFKDLSKVVSQNGVRWSRVNFSVTVVHDRMLNGFKLAVDHDRPQALGNAAQILCGAKRIKEYVESFGVDFDARINRLHIQRLIDAQR